MDAGNLEISSSSVPCFLSSSRSLPLSVAIKCAQDLKDFIALGIMDGDCFKL